MKPKAKKKPVKKAPSLTSKDYKIIIGIIEEVNETLAMEFEFAWEEGEARSISHEMDTRDKILEKLKIIAGCKQLKKPKFT